VTTEAGAAQVTTNKAPRPVDDGEGFSGTRAAEICGITYRQLDYWARTELVRPSLADASGSGSRRQYSYRDLLELKVIKTLLDSGIDLKKVRAVFEYLRQRPDADIASANLVIQGASVLFCDDEELIDVVKGGQGVLNVSLSLNGVRSEIDTLLLPFERPRQQSLFRSLADTTERRAVGD
jgi:DNA-binding transcriptional MerR regulator